ncbi:MAG TPA: hypothetical protein VJ890_01830 [Vineibacter sp.]|nr:hypothetical protein [Vineibacter sp.]
MRKHYMVWYVLIAALTLLGGLVPSVLSGKFVPLQLVVVVAVALVLPPVLIWLMQKMGVSVAQPVHCGRCQTELPALRTPKNLKQGLFGGYDCPNCGAQLDARGRELPAR